MDHLLTPDEAAKRLRVTRGTMYRKISTGQVRAVRLGTGERAPIRIEESELERYAKASTIGGNVAEQAKELVARRGGDADDAAAYVQALKDLDYDAEIFADKVERMVHSDMEATHRAAGHRTLGTHQRVGSDVVDIEAIINEELGRLGNPLPVGVALLGARGLGREALNILHDKGVTEYDAAAYRTAIRQAIKDAINPKREIR